MKKLLSCLLVFTMLTALFCTPALALAEEDYEDGSAFTWSPDLTSNSIIPNRNDSTEVDVYSYFKFDDRAASDNNTLFFFTMEHNARQKYNDQIRAEMDAVYQYSTLPGVHYDVDDDNTDGYSEESEAIHADKSLPIEANKSYYFHTEYSKIASLKSGTMIIGAQRSFLLGEYQAQCVDWLLRDDWSSNAYSVNDQPGETNAESNITQSNDSGKELIFENCDSVEALTNLVNEKNADYSSLLTQRSNIKRGVAEATLTFNAPISMDDLTSLLNSSGAKILNYQARFIDTDGNWCTLASAVLDEETMTAKADEMAEDGGITHAAYEGITSAIVEFDTASNAYNILRNSPLVFLVDMSKFIWENSPEYDPSVEVIVPSYSWQLATLSEGETR
ncbi:hypothetical protein [Flavonifractor sp. An306]|uniref:hypothetical protein n=1 Tax=Flavonifractor sp. An306 TaxID=1965629 RepID=UPI00174835A5|nr:hypothetical protein [Flavonifractor sp. An306]